MLPALPHGPLLPVCDGVWAVRGTFPMAPGVRIGRTMTVVRTPDGLALVNALRLDDAGLAALAALGPVRHLVKLSDAHGADEPWVAETFQPTVWALPGARTGALTVHQPLAGEGPVPGAAVVELVDRAGQREAAWWLPNGGGVLVTTDALQVHSDDEGHNWAGALVGRLMGFSGGVVCPPMWRRTRNTHGAAVTTTLTPLLQRPFAHLVTGHGPPVSDDAFERAREAIASASA